MIEILPSYIPQNEIGIKFETYRFYLESIANQIDIEYSSLENFCQIVIDHTQNIQGYHGFNESWIKRWMKICWNTEFLMEEKTDDIELIRFNNQWKPIQSYYAVYAACEAVAYVLDGNIANGHLKSMRKVTDCLVNKPFSPWNKVYKGARGKSKREHYPVNFPDDINIPSN